MSRFGLSAIALAMCTGVAQADQFVQPLISVSRNINIESWEADGGKLTPGCPIHWTIQKHRLHGGKQEGVDLIVLNNGKLEIIVIPTRGMGILSVTCGDVRLGWDSPVKQVVNPAFINLQSRGGLGWLEGFNEWLCRCGLEYNGHPGTDEFINNVGDKATMELTLHGRIENIPASEVELAVDQQPPYRIHVRGRVDERMFYGPKLELRTDLSTEPGSSSFRVEDVVTNHGPSEQEFELLYHTNYGPPLLEEGSTFLAPVTRVTPFNANAAKGLTSYPTYEAPRLGFIEQVYCLYPLTDENGRSVTMLRNRAKNRAVAIKWSPSELPYLTLWKNTAAEKDGYVTGIEPGTNFPYNRRIERGFGRVPKLAAGQSRHVTLDFSILVTPAEVSQAAAEVDAIQGNRKPTIDPSALAVE